MKYLLDTCILSELMKPTPNTNVVRWVSRRPPDELFISVFTIAEVRRGILRMIPSSRRNELIQIFDQEVLPKYWNQIVSWSVTSAEIWARIFAEGERMGRKPSVFDSQIAATALSHGMTMVTRNINDFRFEDLSVINPFDE